jgi:inner membrane protein
MYKKGHYGAALTAYAPVGMGALAVGFDVAAVGGAVVAVGLAMVPDVDQKLPNVPHRGPTHTVRFAVGVAAVTGILGGVLGFTVTSQWFLVAGTGVYMALVGGITIGSHIAADALTPMGVTPFGDDRHYSYDLWNADSTIGNYALLGLGILSTAIALVIGAELNGLFRLYL